VPDSAVCGATTYRCSSQVILYATYLQSHLCIDVDFVRTALAIKEEEKRRGNNNKVSTELDAAKAYGQRSASSAWNSTMGHVAVGRALASHADLCGMYVYVAVVAAVAVGYSRISQYEVHNDSFERSEL
jgi:hypothetical protein